MKKRAESGGDGVDLMLGMGGLAMKKLVIIDGKSVFYRGYHAMGRLALSDGTPTGGVYGFAVIAMELVKRS